MYVIFFFSSRRRHTRSDRDWSSDVCSSDLTVYDADQPERLGGTQRKEVQEQGGGHEPGGYAVCAEGAPRFCSVELPSYQEESCGERDDEEQKPRRVLYGIGRRKVRGFYHTRSGENEQCRCEPQAPLNDEQHRTAEPDCEDDDQSSAQQEIELLYPAVRRQLEIAYHLSQRRIARRRQPEDGVD